MPNEISIASSIMIDAALALNDKDIVALFFETYLNLKRNAIKKSGIPKRK